MLFLLGTLFAEPVPIYPFPYSCIDPRYPTMHKGWVVGCNPRGMIDQAYHVESMRIQRLSEASESIGFGNGFFQEQHGVWNLQTQQYDAFPRIRTELNAPLSGSGNQWAYTTESSLGILQGRQSVSIDANPRGWYPPAWWGDRVVWVEDDGAGGEDLWIYSASKGASILRGGALSQRHPIANDIYLAWIEGEKIGIWHQEYPEPKFINASVVDRLTMDDNIVCWAQRGEDIDIHCSDGFILHRKGHQVWPSLWNGILIFRESNQLMMYKMEE